MIAIILLLIFLCFVPIIQIGSWINNFQVKRYYNKIANYLQSCSIVYPSIFSYGKVVGSYKGRRVEWRCLMQNFLSFDYPGSFRIEAKMEFNISWEKRSNFFLTRSNKNIFVKDNWIVHSLLQPFVLEEKKILDILHKLYSTVTSCEVQSNESILCLNCNAVISPQDYKCSKCGWSWR